MTNLTTNISIDVPTSGPSTTQLKRDLHLARLRKQIPAFALIAPLAVFLLITFIAPIATLLLRAVEDPEISTTLPETVAALSHWTGTNLPPDSAYAALATDLGRAVSDGRIGALADRLNADLPGSRSVVLRTARALLRMANEGTLLGGRDARQMLISVDARWGDTAYWQVIAQNSTYFSSHYILSSLDFEKKQHGRIQRVPADRAIFTAIFTRTFEISLVVTILTLAIAYPLAYWLSTMPAKRANSMMILVLIPFWTSVLVRIAAWIVLLQTNGVVNKTLSAVHLIDDPLSLLFNRSGVYVAMIHILLPFMILPLYSVMKSISPEYVRAAVSLGSHPFAAFWRVYVPQTIPGVTAGSLMVFILGLGYYITPALLGGPNEQMISYYIAYYLNVVINWGMASALGATLLMITLILFCFYGRSSALGTSVA